MAHVSMQLVLLKGCAVLCVSSKMDAVQEWLALTWSSECKTFVFDFCVESPEHVMYSAHGALQSRWSPAGSGVQRQDVTEYCLPA